MVKDKAAKVVVRVNRVKLAVRAAKDSKIKVNKAVAAKVVAKVVVKAVNRAKPVRDNLEIRLYAADLRARLPLF